MTIRLAVCIISTLVLGASARICAPDNVEGEINITQPPMNLTTIEGKTIQIMCRVFGAPKPEIKWIRNGLELTGGRYKTLDEGDLKIENVTLLDAGIYTCYASNIFGEVNASASLIVKEHTKIIDKPEDWVRPAGFFARFRCNAVADPTLPLTINWLRDGEPIDFKMDRRFRQTTNYLRIKNTTVLDSGVYTCIARTDLDEVRAQATLVVQDAPNAPRIVGMKCNLNSTMIEWIPMGDNGAPILHYMIKYNTTYRVKLSTWDSSMWYIPPTVLRCEIPTLPWTNYTFHVFALNEIGSSLPSPHSTGACNTEADVPYGNPSNVMGKGTTPQNLVISWKRMTMEYHNGPKFQYKIFYRRDIPCEDWVTIDVHDWKKDKVVVENQPTYQKYRIKVVAMNEKGECRIPADEVIGYSGEDVPLQAPDNFTLNEIKSRTTVELSWTPVPEEMVRGELQGYKIQTWTDKDGEEGMREIDIRGGDKTHALITRLVPYSKNFARILAYNGRYAGPASETLSFDMPEGVPEPVRHFKVFNMGSSALFLNWTRPAKTNGILTGYIIDYEVASDTLLKNLLERQPHVVDPQATSAILAPLASNTIYRVFIRATTKVGNSGFHNMIERKTGTPQRPDIPRFTWEIVPVENGYSNLRVTWLPNLDGNPGSYFFVQYKLKGETIFLETMPEFQSTYVEIHGLRSGEVYTMSVVAVDGDYMSESAPIEVEMRAKKQRKPVVQPKKNATAASL